VQAPTRWCATRLAAANDPADEEGSRLPNEKEPHGAIEAASPPRPRTNSSTDHGAQAAFHFHSEIRAFPLPKTLPHCLPHLSQPALYFVYPISRSWVDCSRPHKTGHARYARMTSSRKVQGHWGWRVLLMSYARSSIPLIRRLCFMAVTFPSSIRAKAPLATYFPGCCFVVRALNATTALRLLPLDRPRPVRRFARPTMSDPDSSGCLCVAASDHRWCASPHSVVRRHRRSAETYFLWPPRRGQQFAPACLLSQCGTSATLASADWVCPPSRGGPITLPPRSWAAGLGAEAPAVPTRCTAQLRFLSDSLYFAVVSADKRPPVWSARAAVLRGREPIPAANPNMGDDALASVKIPGMIGLSSWPSYVSLYNFPADPCLSARPHPAHW